MGAGVLGDRSPAPPREPRKARCGPLTCDEGRLCRRLLQEDHVLQQGARGRPCVTLQGRRAQVGGEVGAGEEGNAFAQGNGRRSSLSDVTIPMGMTLRLNAGAAAE